MATIKVLFPDGTVGDIDASKQKEAIADGLVPVAASEQGIKMRFPDNTTGFVPSDKANDALKDGLIPITAEEEEFERYREANSGLAGAAGAALEGVSEAVSFGTIPAIAKKITGAVAGEEAEREYELRHKARKAEWPMLYAGADIVASLVPAVASGGLSLIGRKLGNEAVELSTKKALRETGEGISEQAAKEAFSGAAAKASQSTLGRGLELASKIDPLGYAVGLGATKLTDKLAGKVASRYVDEAVEFGAPTSLSTARLAVSGGRVPAKVSEYAANIGIGATQGAIQGAAQGVGKFASDVIFEDAELSAENLLATVGAGAAFGAGLGAAIPVAVTAAKRTLPAARNLLESGYNWSKEKSLTAIAGIRDDMKPEDVTKLVNSLWDEEIHVRAAALDEVITSYDRIIPDVAAMTTLERNAYEQANRFAEGIARSGYREVVGNINDYVTKLARDSSDYNSFADVLRVVPEANYDKALKLTRNLVKELQDNAALFSQRTARATGEDALIKAESANRVVDKSINKFTQEMEGLLPDEAKSVLSSAIGRLQMGAMNQGYDIALNTLSAWADAKTTASLIDVIQSSKEYTRVLEGFEAAREKGLITIENGVATLNKEAIPYNVADIRNVDSVKENVEKLRQLDNLVEASDDLVRNIRKDPELSRILTTQRVDTAAESLGSRPIYERNGAMRVDRASEAIPAILGTKEGGKVAKILNTVAGQPTQRLDTRAGIAAAASAGLGVGLDPTLGAATFVAQDLLRSAIDPVGESVRLAFAIQVLQSRKDALKATGLEVFGLSSPTGAPAKMPTILESGEVKNGAIQGLLRVVKERGAALGIESALRNVDKLMNTRKEDKKDKERIKTSLLELETIQSLASNPEVLIDAVVEATSEIASLDPATGEQAQQALTRGVLFLADKAPKRPTTLLPSVAWAPTPAQLSEWDRYVKAINDPYSLLEDIKKGDVRPQSIEAVKTVYPRIFQEMQQELLLGMIESDQPVPYKIRLNLARILQMPEIVGGIVSAADQASLAAAEAEAQAQAAPRRSAAKESRSQLESTNLLKNS